ncbi:MAG: hypothetical protein GY948_21800 [Alphaproteobacteria bacterium]|nr:hypothetical protein [Alphaproteobacteria bacterium]
MRTACLVLLIGVLAWAAQAQADQDALTQEQINKLLQHGPWPLRVEADPSNRVSGNPGAIELGRTLFFDPKLSGSGNMACSTCHHPGRGWTDKLPRAFGIKRLDRNTQSLFNVRFNRWFGWDGQNDNLWAQSIRPIINPDEMHATPKHVVQVLGKDQNISGQYQDVFGAAPGEGTPEQTLANVGKALAAFQETIVTARTPFDAFRDGLANNDRKAIAAYPASARRGAALFFGRGNCTFCHTGPLFTNGEFQDAGVPYFIEPGRVDKGRFAGIAKLKSSAFTLAGKHTDDPAKTGAWKVRGVKPLHRNFGEFRVPSLRNLTKTAPYMHDGSLATLEDVVRHYSQIDVERLHADGTRILAPLHLNKNETQDLVNFLESLSTE